MTMSNVRREAKSLTEEPLDLIRHILDKHHESVLEVLKEQVLMLKAVRKALRAYDEGLNPKQALSHIEVAVNPERYRCDPLEPREQ